MVFRVLNITTNQLTVMNSSEVDELLKEHDFKTNPFRFKDIKSMTISQDRVKLYIVERKD